MKVYAVLELPGGFVVHVFDSLDKAESKLDYLYGSPSSGEWIVEEWEVE